jgi:hypothetical protein
MLYCLRAACPFRRLGETPAWEQEVNGENEAGCRNGARAPHGTPDEAGQPVCAASSRRVDSSHGARAASRLRHSREDSRWPPSNRRFVDRSTNATPGGSSLAEAQAQWGWARTRPTPPRSPSMARIRRCIFQRGALAWPAWGLPCPCRGLPCSCCRALTLVGSVRSSSWRRSSGKRSRTMPTGRSTASRSPPRRSSTGTFPGALDCPPASSSHLADSRAL